MELLLRRPGLPLSEAVLVLTALELTDATEFGPPDRIVPDGIVEIVFQFGTPFRMRRGEGSFETLSAGFAVSQTHSFIEIAPQGPGGFVSARLFPWGATRLLNLPVSEFSDRAIPAAQLWPDTEPLQQQLADTDNNVARLGLLETFLSGKLGEDDDEVRSWIHSIQLRKGDVAIGSLCKGLGIGQRRLERRFRRSLGTTPKHFARLTRFLTACRALKDDAPGALAEVALECGYSDQAHFNRNFKAFSGLTPRQFVEREVSFLGDDG